jgi:hypothetical protein
MRKWTALLLLAVFSVACNKPSEIPLALVSGRDGDIFRLMFKLNAPEAECAVNGKLTVEFPETGRASIIRQLDISEKSAFLAVDVPFVPGPAQSREVAFASVEWDLASYSGPGSCSLFGSGQVFTGKPSIPQGVDAVEAFAMYTCFWFVAATLGAGATLAGDCTS